jgi:hypothetical protein
VTTSRQMKMATAAVIAACLCACGGTEPHAASSAPAAVPVAAESGLSENMSVATADLPPALIATVQRAVPGMVIGEAQRKSRDGRVYFDVEGKRPDGADVELDILTVGDTYRVVEIQRDIAYAAVPASARAAAEAAPGAFVPERVIESIQNDGSVIYELFAPGKPDDPAREVRVHAGRAEVLLERWQH